MKRILSNLEEQNINSVQPSLSKLFIYLVSWNEYLNIFLKDLRNEQNLAEGICPDIKIMKERKANKLILYF